MRKSLRRTLTVIALVSVAALLPAGG